MKRRNFIKLGSAASVASIINGLPVKAFADSPMLNMLAKQTASNGRVMVMIQLSGGNDGLNTIIPLDQYSPLSNLRSNVLIPESSVLGINGTVNTGLHPAMGGNGSVEGGIQNLYNNEWVNIIQGVSYPNPNYSHFRSTDIWLSGSDSDQYLESGWIGRYLSDRYTNYPVGYPNTDMPDPLAIQIGTGLSPLLQGPDMNMGMAIPAVSNFYNMVNGTVAPAPGTNGGHELTFVRQITQQSQAYNTVIQNAAANAQNLYTNYPDTELAAQLKIVARLIAAGLQTPVYVVNMTGFDTHADQVDPSDHTQGTHASLLKELSDAVSAFFQDCTLLNIADRVAAMSFSEFGRRIKSNASGGTDHGSAQPVMVFGPGVNPGIIGSNPVIPQNTTVADNIPMQHDFRSIYAAILADWFEVPQTTMNNILLQNYPILPVFKGSTSVQEHEAISSQNNTLGQNYPNPVRTTSTISFHSEGGITTVQLFDASGRQVQTITNQYYSKGDHNITFNRNGLPAGNYFYKLSNGIETQGRSMLIID